ncbi:MAG: hypothetical protein LBE08_00755 [Bifidobacteriaceae bacterium]|jgi:hypothetical protein|nr:hypothetical protein [Bifidobacteriaceae bacterium]
MDKASLESLTAQLKEQQAAVTYTVDQLKEQLAPAALAEATKDKLTRATKAAWAEPSGRPKRWVLVAGAVVFALVVTGIVVRLAGRSK